RLDEGLGPRGVLLRQVDRDFSLGVGIVIILLKITVLEQVERADRVVLAQGRDADQLQVVIPLFLSSRKKGPSSSSARPRDSSSALASDMDLMPGAGDSLLRARVNDPISAVADGSTGQPRSRNPSFSARRTAFPGGTPPSANRPSTSLAVAWPCPARKTRA